MFPTWMKTLFDKLLWASRPMKLITCEIENIPGMLNGFSYFIEEKIEGEKVLFLIDTGASCSIFDTNFVVLKLRTAPSLRSTGEVTSMMGHRVRTNTFRTNIFGIEGLYFSAELTHFIEKFGRNIGGIIGTDLLQKLNATIDLKKQVLKIRAC